jgi:ketosteroid isomerase-like protein
VSERDDEPRLTVQRLAARAAIGDLHARYCFIQDRGHSSHAESDVQAFLALCHPDIVWDNSPDQSRAHRGHAAVADYLRALWVRFDSCMHFVHNLLVELDSDTRARGRSSFDAMGDIEGEAFVAAGYYENEYIRTDNGWQFLLHREVPFFFVKVSEGWAGAKPKIMAAWTRRRP